MEDTIATVTIITYILGLYVPNLLITKMHLPWLPFWKMKTVSPQGIYVWVRGVQGKKKKKNKPLTVVFCCVWLLPIFTTLRFKKYACSSASTRTFFSAILQSTAESLLRLPRTPPSRLMLPDLPEIRTSKSHSLHLKHASTVETKPGPSTEVSQLTNYML